MIKITTKEGSESFFFDQKKVSHIMRREEDGLYMLFIHMVGNENALRLEGSPGQIERIIDLIDRGEGGEIKVKDGELE